MRLQILLIAFTIIHICAFGQTADTLKIKETLPEFPGGKERMMKILEDSMRYPKDALENRIGGKVVTQFVVDTGGHVVNIRVLQGVRPDLDNEAIRLVGLLDGWKPGTSDGKKVRVQYTLPMTFYPDNRWKKRYKKRH
jgi:TonB family protein